GTTYRLSFEGNTAGNFTGRVFQGTTQLLTVTNGTPDTTYGAGFSGLIVAEDTAGAINGADATWDNYLSAPVNPVPEPGTWALTAEHEHRRHRHRLEHHRPEHREIGEHVEERLARRQVQVERPAEQREFRQPVPRHHRPDHDQGDRPEGEYHGGDDGRLVARV